MNALEITDNSFGEVINTEKVVVVDFWAEWCGPCKMVGPVIEEIAGEYKDKAVIAKMDIESNSETPMKYGVRSIPTILFIKNGEVVDKQVGFAPKPKLTEILEKHL